MESLFEELVVVTLEELMIISSAEFSIILSAELEIVFSEELLISSVAFGMVVEPAVVGLSEEQATNAVRAIAPVM